MTTGNLNWDRQVPTATDWGSIATGTYTSRVWNGTDWPQTKHVDRPALVDPVKGYTKKGYAILDKQIAANNRAQIDLYKRTVRSSQLRKNRLRIINGDKPHPYTYTINSGITRTDGILYAGNPKVYVTTPMQQGGNPIALWTSWWGPEEDTLLVNRLKTKLLGSSFNAGVFIAELGPALSMIINAASRLYRSRKALLKGDLVGAWRTLSPMGSTFAPKVRRGQPIASQWLEMSYGWLPLVKDLEDAAVMLAYNDVVNPAFFVARSRAKKGGLTDLTWRKAAAVLSEPWFYGAQEERGQIVAYLREVNVPQLLGLTDAASVAWEVTPFSFLGDYVIPIGNYLAARGVAQALKGEFVTSRKREVFVQDFTYRGVQFASVPHSVFKKRYITGSRMVSTSLSVPLPTVKPLNEIYKWRRAANVIALLVTTGSLPKGVRG